jgi:hypothetical protein
MVAPESKNTASSPCCHCFSFSLSLEAMLDRLVGWLVGLYGSQVHIKGQAMFSELGIQST